MTASHPANPPADWYPDPTDAGSLRYWDGGGWTAHTRPVAPAPAPAKPSPAGLGSPGGAVQVLLGLSGVAALVVMGIQLWGAALVQVGVADPQQLDISMLELYDTLTQGSAPVILLLGLVGGVAWLSWQHQLASAVPRTMLRRSPSWHVLSWLIPLVNLVFPFQNLADLHRAVTPPVNGRRPPTPALFGFWWAAWLGSGLAASLGSSVGSMPEPSLTVLVQAILTLAVGQALHAIAAVLAILIVRDLTRAALLTLPMSPVPTAGFNLVT